VGDLLANISLQSGIGEFIWREKKSIPKKDFFVVDKYPNIFANWKPIQFFRTLRQPLMGFKQQVRHRKEQQAE
jgi:hypothetical protein